MGRKKNTIPWQDMPEGKEKRISYMKSQEWLEVKKLVLERDGYKCRCCSRTSDQATLSVHHSTYEHLYDEKNHLDDLVTLCLHYCHHSIHLNKANFHRFKKPNESSNQSEKDKPVKVDKRK